MQLKNQTAIELTVQEVNIPGITIGIIEHPWQSMKDKMPGDSIEFNNLTLTVILDEDLKSLKEIIDNCMISHNPTTNTYHNKNALFDATLHLTSNKNNVKHTLTFYDAWIQSFSDISLQTTSSEDEQVTVQFEIVYNYYTFS
jgi:hypothetical protein